jgi:hypothetical protein
MTEVFSQDLCTMEPFKDSLRWVVSRKQSPPCTVRVADGKLTVTQESGEVLVRRRTAGLKIVTPRRLRKMEAGVVLELGGKPVAVMFDLVYGRQQSGATAKPAATSRGNMALAGQITAEFMTVLLAAGAIDVTGPA